MRKIGGMTNADERLFPPLEPFDTGMLPVGEGHEIYWEQCGNPAGLPALLLHGGPGSGCNARQRRFFDPRCYRIVLFDQRGSGRSRPLGQTAGNATAQLLADIERLRATLSIDGWLVFGGSWGSSLAVAYAAAQPAAVRGMILRGIFLTGRRDLQWFFLGLRELLPDAWQRFATLAPKRHRRRLLQYYARRLSDDEGALEAAGAWAEYERAAIAVLPEDAPPAAAPDAALIAKYRVQAHYLARHCFLGEATLLRLAGHCGGIPTAILHGRLDLVCRADNALRLHRALPGSRLHFVAGAGHSPFDEPMAAALVAATNHFAEHGSFSEWGERL
jgi:proline iminopeptidase